jgi:hypothetical protein
MALRLLSRYHARVGQPTASPHAAAVVLQGSAQWPRHVAISASSKDTTVITDPSTSGRDSSAAASTSELPKQQFIWPKLQSKFCRMCGGSMDIVQPEGDKEWRHVCKSCGYIGKQRDQGVWQ